MKLHEPVITIPLEIEPAIALLSLRFMAEGLRVATSFEIDSACATLSDNVCTHDPNKICKCRMRVLKVWDDNSTPLHLVVHEYDRETEFFIDVGECIEDFALEGTLRRLLQEERLIIQSVLSE